MFQLLYFFVFFAQLLNCSSNSNNQKKVVKVERKKTPDELKNQKAITGYLIQNRSNNQKNNDKKSTQNDDDDDRVIDNNEVKNLLFFEKKEDLDDFLEGLDEIETEEPVGLSKKNGHSKLSFPSKEILEGKLNPGDLKKAKEKENSQTKLDFKGISALTVETQDLTKSGQISNANESSSENVSTFNSWRSEKNDGFQKQ